MGDPITPMTVFAILNPLPAPPEAQSQDDDDDEEDPAYKPIPVSHDPFEVIEI